MPDSQPDVSELAREVVAELEDTRQIGDQLLLSRREAIALSTGAISLGAVGVAGAGSASAQEAAGQIGTESERVNVFANELDVNNLTLDEAIDLVDGDVDFGGNDINNFGTASGEALDVSTVESDVDHDENDINNFGTASGEALEAGSATISDTLRRTSSGDGTGANEVTYPNLTRDVEDFTSETTSVETTSKTIADISGMSYTVVIGSTVGTGSGGRFADVLFCAGFDTVNVIASGESGADGRTYSVDENNLELAMAGGEYDIIVKSTRMQ